MDDLHQVTEERLYDQLMEEFPSWIRKLRRRGSSASGAPETQGGLY
ncbi:VWA domain-containing protein [Pseudomonas aeruginosa]|nr:VWA domain-containing protein [Pseudomonas aeruginosa]